MSRLRKRSLVLGLILSILPLTVAHADGAPPPPAPSSVTGGSPEPTSPTVVDIILSVLHLA